jgi:hypothetical protein
MGLGLRLKTFPLPAIAFGFQIDGHRSGLLFSKANERA